MDRSTSEMSYACKIQKIAYKGNSEKIEIYDTMQVKY